MSLQQWRTQVKGPQSFAANYAKQGSEQQVEANIATALQRLSDKRWDAVRGTPEGQAFVAEIEAWADQIRQETKAMATQKAADSALRSLESQFRFYASYVKQKNERSILSCRETCTKIIHDNAHVFARAKPELQAKVSGIASQLGLTVTFGSEVNAASSPPAPAAPAAASEAPSSSTPAAPPSTAAAPAPPDATFSPGTPGAYDQASFATLEKKIRSDLRWMKQHTDASRVRQYMDQVTTDVTTNLPLLQAEGKFLAEINEAFAEVNAKFAKAALEAAQRGCEREKRWVETHLQRGAQDNVVSAREALVKAIEEHRSVLLRSPEGQTFLEEMSGYLLDLGVRFEALKLQQEADALVRRATSEMRWVTTHLSRKDTSSASRAWERLQVVVAPLLSTEIGPSKFAGLPQLEKFLPEYNALESRVDAEICAIVVDAEVESLSRRASSEQRWTDTFLGNGDPQHALPHLEDLQKIADTLRSYVGHVQATEKAETVAKFVEDAQERIQPIIERQEVEAIIRPTTQTVYWLTDALRLKNEDKCILLREQLVDRIAPLRSRYPAQPDAVKFLGEVDTLLADMESRLGSIIAEKDSLRLLRAAESPYRWLENSIANKDVRRAQLYLEQLAQAMPPLIQYREQFANVAEFLGKATALQTRVAQELGTLLADAEIDAMSRRINSPLSFFRSALASRDPETIVPRRQRLIEAAMPLKSSRHAPAPAAAAILKEVDEALVNCDRDMSTILGDAAVKRIGAKVRSCLSWAQGAAERKDSRGALANLQEAHKVLQPLRIEHPNHAGAQLLIKEADAATTALGTAIGDAMNSAEGTDLLRKASGPLTEADQLNQRGDLVSAAAALRQANAAAAGLRARFAFRADVQQHLAKLDALNVALLGGVPQDEESAPSIEIDWRLPVAVQDVVKRINVDFQTYNDLIGEWTRECDSTIDVEGTKRAPPDWWLERCNAACERAVKIVSRVQEESVPQLAAVAPEHPAIALVQDVAPRLAAKAVALKAFAGPMLNYHIAMHSLKEGWDSPLRGFSDNYTLAKRGDRNDEPSLWAKCADSLKATLKRLPEFAAIAATLPEGYDNTPAEMFKDVIEGNLIEAEAQFRVSCLKHHKLAAQESNLWRMNEYKKLLGERFPGCDEERELLTLHTRVETVLAEEAAKAAEEARLKREAHEREVAKMLADSESEFVIPYQADATAEPTHFASGEATPAKWQWHGSEGTLIDESDNSTYIWKANPTCIKLTHIKNAAERGFAIFNPSRGSFALKSEFKGDVKTWVQYEYDSGSKSFMAMGNSFPSWTYDANKGSLVASGSADAKGAFGASEWSCKGIPPPVALFVAICRDFVAKKIPDWVKAKEKALAEAAARGSANNRCDSWPARSPAWICSRCAFGSGADSCGVCGGWPSKKGDGVVCSSHDFGSMSSNCKKCGNWEPTESNRVAFPLCNSCSFGSAKDKCCATV